MGLIMMRPRFWVWDMGGGLRTRFVAAGSALVVCLANFVMLWMSIGIFGLREARIDWADALPVFLSMISNAMVCVVAMVALAPVFGPAIAGALVFVVVLGLAGVRSLWWDLDLIPITRYRLQGPLGQIVPNYDTHFLAVGVLLVVAAGLHFWFRGSTRWAWQVFQKEH